MPRTKLAALHPENPNRPPRAEPITLILPPPEEKNLRKLPGYPFFIDVTTNLVYVDPQISKMLT